MRKIILISLLALLPIFSYQKSLTIEKSVSSHFTQQVVCMAKNIYYESGSETYEGKLAVAQVTLNRVNNPRYPKDVCGVVYQKNVINNTMICQFSWTCNKDTLTRNKYTWEESLFVAKKALTESNPHDAISKSGALYYHAVYVNPGWNLPKTTQIGRHIFYKRYTDTQTMKKEIKI